MWSAWGTECRIWLVVVRRSRSAPPESIPNAPVSNHLFSLHPTPCHHFSSLRFMMMRCLYSRLYFVSIIFSWASREEFVTVEEKEQGGLLYLTYRPLFKQRTFCSLFRTNIALGWMATWHKRNSTPYSKSKRKVTEVSPTNFRVNSTNKYYAYRQRYICSSFIHGSIHSDNYFASVFVNPEAPPRLSSARLHHFLTQHVPIYSAMLSL